MLLRLGWQQLSADRLGQRVESRFGAAASWQPYGGPGGWNDYDSIEVGNGSNDGLTTPERQTQLSLWSLASAPLILGTDLTAWTPAIWPCWTTAP